MRLKSHKLSHYYAAYEAEFPKTVHSILEIGVAGGGSMEHWLERYPRALVTGIDIDPHCLAAESMLADERLNIRIGSQADPAFLRAVEKDLGPFDVIIDDGSHFPRHQQTAFRTLWPRLMTGGVYCIEDICTRWLPLWKFRNWTGDVLSVLTGSLDYMHAHWRGGKWSDIRKISIYDSMMFLHKGHTNASEVVTGKLDCRL